ncbi:MAG: hypothetical protein M1837_005828 [Sclerophora amabilis]|nr:MAG: hypothetical protein M1837_005828 [Sclerophora amabilis]
MVRIEPDYIAVGGNRHPAAADWDTVSGILAFGADRNIALWDPLRRDQRGVHALLAGHTDKVNVVKFTHCPSSKRRLIISGAVDKSIRVWKEDRDLPKTFVESSILTDHESSINCIAVEPRSNVFVSGSADATVKVWKIEASSNEDVDVALLQTVTIAPRFFPLSLALSRLPASADPLVLAVAGTKGVVQIYVSQSDEVSPEFSLRATLVGHEGWVRSLAFTREHDDTESDLLLASASQDRYIRLWRIHQGEHLPPPNNAGSDPALGTLAKSLSNKAHRFQADGCKYSVTFEALLIGHEDWIYTAAWRQGGQQLQLLSASADSSLALWEPDVSSGVWVCVGRLGEISGLKGATTATGSIGGFWIGLWSPTGESVMSLGRTGSWRVWDHDRGLDRWNQRVGISGHVKEVTGVSWSTDGKFLLSTSSDQTSRLFAEWKRNGQQTWHEFARPQIHGYDLNCIDRLGDSRFVSGADEKLLRVFEEPRAIATLLDKLCHIGQSSQVDYPEAANMPVLGLSNKAIQVKDDGEVAVHNPDNEREAVDPASIIHKSTLDLDHPPLEEHLSRHTLWPESEKLYGHGYEISAVACSHDNSLVATACRASSIDHAVIRLFDTKDWREIKPPLTAHSLTIARLRFSDDDLFLLSVGRDRQWAVFERDHEQQARYSLICSNPKAHSRMILDAAWAPTKAGRLFATAGRDKSVKFWMGLEDLKEDGFTSKASISAGNAVTAVDILPEVVQGVVYLAMGTENGTLGFWGVDIRDYTTQQIGTFDPSIIPSRSITQVSWRPQVQSPSSFDNGTGNRHDFARFYELAVSSEDSSLRSFRVYGIGG